MSVQIIDEVSPRSRDTIVGLGERLACKIMTAVLRDQVTLLRHPWSSPPPNPVFTQGIDAEYVSLDDVVPQEDDSDSANPSSLDQSFYDRLTVALGERIQQCGPRVPVVTGTELAPSCNTLFLMLRLQASSAQYLAPYCTKSVAGTPTSSPPFSRLASKRRSSRSGRKLTASSPPTRARCPPRGCCPSSRPKRQPSSRTMAARSSIRSRWSRSSGVRSQSASRTLKTRRVEGRSFNLTRTSSQLRAVRQEVQQMAGSH